MTKSEKPAGPKPETYPTAGGSYVRKDDGALDQVAATREAPPAQAVPTPPSNPTQE